MLVIHPDECIDCGVCEPECPVDAIVPDTGWNDPAKAEEWTIINRQYSEIWPNITEAKDPPPDAEEWNNIPNKYEEHFSEAPGEGD
jgi:ferredoxin